MIETNTEFKKDFEEMLVMFFDRDFDMQIFHEQMRAGKLYEIFKVDGKTFEYEFVDPVGSELVQKSLREALRFARFVSNLGGADREDTSMGKFYWHKANSSCKACDRKRRGQGICSH